MVGRPDLSGPAHGGYCRVPAYHPEAGHYRGGDRGICHLDCRPRRLTYLFEHKERGRAIFGGYDPSRKSCPAVTYSPRGLPPKYHRRCSVSLPCSERERVVPKR